MRVNLDIIFLVGMVSNIVDTETVQGNKKHQNKYSLVPKQKFLHYNTIVFENLSQLKMLQQNINQNFLNITKEVETSNRRCFCERGLCSCCSHKLLSLWKQKACINITYDPDEFAFTIRITMNDKLLYTRTISGKNPRPLCVPIPRIPAVRACIRFFNIYFQGRNIHACINMESKFQETILFKIGINCMRLGSNGVAIIKPEDGGGINQIQFLPISSEQNVDFADDYEEYNYNNGDDIFFDY